MRTTVKPLTREQVDHVVEIAMRHYGYPQEFAPQVSMTDEFGWADEKSPIIMWEEGPESFGYEFNQNDEARSYLQGLGFYMEAATSWAISIYPIEGEVAGSYGWCGNPRHPFESHKERNTCFAFQLDTEA